MARPMPTMADALYRESLRSPTHRKFRDIATTPKFVLEKDVYHFMDGLMRDRILQSDDVFRNVRLMSRMPFERIWIEPAPDMAEVWVRGSKGSSMGWWLERHPSLDTMVRLTVVIMDARQQIMAMPFSIIWSNTDSPATWPYWEAIKDEHGEDPIMATIASKGQSSVKLHPAHPDTIGMVFNDLVDFEYVEGRSAADLVVELHEYSVHAFLNIMAFLATIDELPVISRDVKPSRGYFARGKHRDFMEYRIVRLSIPVERATKKLANHLLTPSRRKRHEVRGAWRRLTQDRVDTCPKIEHDWYIDDKYRLCLKCGAEGVFIAEHLRGDAALGWVMHDYHVQRGEHK